MSSVAASAVHRRFGGGGGMDDNVEIDADLSNKFFGHVDPPSRSPDWDAFVDSVWQKPFSERVDFIASMNAFPGQQKDGFAAKLDVFSDEALLQLSDEHLKFLPMKDLGELVLVR